MRRSLGSALDVGVFGVSLGISVLFVLWGVLYGETGRCLFGGFGCLLANGLVGLQTAAIISAAPFVLVMIGLCYSLFKELRTEGLAAAPEPRGAPEPERAAGRPRGAPAPQRFGVEREGGGR